MAMPVAGTKLGPTLHLALHNIHVNVKAFGAVGDGVADDTAAIQAAYDALGEAGTLFFPPGNYKISSAINAGRATAFNHSMIGGGGSYSNLTFARITQTNLSAHIFNITMTSGQGNAITIDGLQLFYSSAATGTAIRIVDPGNYVSGLVVKNCLIQNAGVGARVVWQVAPLFKEVTFQACSTSVELGGGMNIPTFENCRFAAGAIGIDMQTLCADFRATSCTWESLTNAGIRIASAAQGGPGGLHDALFESCWWEAISGDCIQINGQSAGWAGYTWKFLNCFLGAEAHMINNTPGLGANTRVDGICFDSCYFNAGGGDILWVAQNPTGSGDPGYGDVTFINCHGSGAALKGIYPLGMGYGGLNIIGSGGPAPADIVPGGDVIQYFATANNANNAILTNSSVRALNGVQTLYASGAGKTTVTDADFKYTPTNGTLAVHYDTSGAKGYLSFRANGVWKVATPGGI